MDYRFDFDDALPDLPAAFDLDAVTELFERKLPGYPGGGTPARKITVHKLQDAKYQPSQACVATYEMEIETPGAPRLATIGVLEFGPDGVTARLFPADRRLPWLETANTLDEMDRRFTRLLNGVPEGPKSTSQEIRLVEIQPVRYKPGLHCVFRYIVQTPTGHRTFYGKLFAKGGDRLMETITALHQVSETAPGMPRIPQPVGYWPDLQMILQPAVADGVEFTRFAYDTNTDAAEREEWMRKAGVSLGVFHQTMVPGELRTIQDDLADLEEYTAAMVKVKPELAEKYRDAIHQIMAKASGHKEPQPMAGHGAMRTDQFILQGDRLAMIDLDGYCWANPARDLGNFLAYLCWKAIRQPEHGQFVERAGRAFLEGYLEVRQDIDEHWLSIYQAASLLKIAGRRFRNLTFREWPLVIHLIESALATLKEDLGNLEPGSTRDHRGTLVAHLSTSTGKTKYPATFIDREFPALWGALNAEMMSAELGPILQTVACPDQPACVRRAKLLAYKPGKRGVIRYDLDGVGCRDYSPVFGKLYPEPYLCERAFTVMTHLWEDVFQGVPDLCVPQPLGYIPELSMLVFVPVEGRFISELMIDHPLDSPEVVRTMELAGAWLAQLHTHPFPLEKEFKIENEVDNIREWADLISHKYPDEARVAAHIAAFLVQKVAELDFDLNVPIHKDFHYEHILIDGGLKVFDFDEMRLGDPNFDLAHFCANFYLLAFRNQKHTSQFSRLQNTFFNAYASRTGWELSEKFLFFYVYSCLKIAKQLCKLRGPRPWPEGEDQHAQVWLMLEQGLVTMAYAKARKLHTDTALPVVEFSQIRRSGWLKAGRISKSGISSEVIRVSHRPLS